jgi:hypothetical protein
MDQQLEWIAQIQGRWSLTANRLKSVYERVRWITFGFSILGALGAAIASQREDSTRLALAVVSAVLFGVATFLTARFLGAAHAIAWVRARAASEALKRAAYSYATVAAPYDDPLRRDEQLRSDVQKIETDVDDLLGQQASPVRGSTPSTQLDPSAYRAVRVLGAVDWYERSASEYQVVARRLRRIEFSLALVTTALTAIVGALSKVWLRETTGFDWVVLTAVLTTISGAILTHVEASRYDILIVIYRAAARRLREELVASAASLASPSADWSAFVERCEAIIAQENGSWVARFGKP